MPRKLWTAGTGAVDPVPAGRMDAVRPPGKGVGAGEAGGKEVHPRPAGYQSRRRGSSRTREAPAEVSSPGRSIGSSAARTTTPRSSSRAAASERGDRSSRTSSRWRSNNSRQRLHVFTHSRHEGGQPGAERADVALKFGAQFLHLLRGRRRVPQRALARVAHPAVVDLGPVIHRAVLVPAVALPLKRGCLIESPEAAARRRPVCGAKPARRVPPGPSAAPPPRRALSGRWCCARST